MNEKFNLETIDISQLPELQGWREKQEIIVKENPFVEIIDNKTFEEARKSRTNLVTARTTIEKQEKLIVSKLKEFREKVGGLTNDLISITFPHEEKQQEEVKRYEAEKLAEKEAKEKAEGERKKAIENKIEAIYQTEKTNIENLLFSNIETKKAEFEKTLSEINVSEFEEFEIQFASKVQLLKQQLQDKIQILSEKENQRLETEKFAKEKAEFEAKQEKARKENEDLRLENEAKQKTIDEANLKKEAELNAKQKAIYEAEAKRKSEIEAEEKSKKEAEQKAIDEKKAEEKAEFEAKRIEKLKPIIEKLTDWVNGFEIAESPLSEDNSNVKEISKKFNEFKNWAKQEVSNIN